MAKVYVPTRLPDEYPQPVSVMKAVAGATAGDVLITSSAIYDVIQFPAGAYIYDVAYQVTTAFTASVDLNIGTSTDPDGFAAVGTIDATAAGAGWRTCKGDALDALLAAASSATLPAYLQGFLVPSTGEALTVQVETATAATGSIRLLAFYTMAPNVGTSVARKQIELTKQWKAGIS